MRGSLSRSPLPTTPALPQCQVGPSLLPRRHQTPAGTTKILHHLNASLSGVRAPNAASNSDIRILVFPSSLHSSYVLASHDSHWYLVQLNLPERSPLTTSPSPFLFIWTFSNDIAAAGATAIGRVVAAVRVAPAARRAATAAVSATFGESEWRRGFESAGESDDGTRQLTGREVGCFP